MKRLRLDKHHRELVSIDPSLRVKERVSEALPEEMVALFGMMFEHVQPGTELTFRLRLPRKLARSPEPKLEASVELTHDDGRSTLDLEADVWQDELHVTRLDPRPYWNAARGGGQ